jgi:hypothetical protein
MLFMRFNGVLTSHSELIRRIRALTFRLLPVQVDLDTLSDPTSRVITSKVINAYATAAGDFGEAVRTVSNCPRSDE